MNATMYGQPVSAPMYGVRSPNPGVRPNVPGFWPAFAVVKAGPRREDAEAMVAFEDDVIVVSNDYGQTWHEVIR